MDNIEQMAQRLPQLVVLKSGDYAFFMHATASVRGYVSCTEKSVFEPYAKIAAERSTTDTRYVHLRFTASNQYMSRPDPNGRWIVAGSNQPEEDLKKPTCTLFQPFISGQTVYFLHAQSGRAVAKDRSNSRLCLDQFSARATFDFLDWETLVQLPKHVALIGYNDKYVDIVRAQGREYLRCLGEDANTGITANEVQLHGEGFLRFRSLQYDRFWVRSLNWVCADSNDRNGTDRETLFWPVKVDQNTIALRTPGNNMFIVVQPYKRAYLSAEVNTITNEAKFKVEELVLERSIYNTVYRMEDSRIYDERPFVAGEGSARNDTDREAVLTVTVRFEEKTSFTFTNSVSVMLGVKINFRAGFPFIIDGKIQVSTEITNTLEWNRTQEETKSVEASYTLTAPPRSLVQVTYLGTRGTCDVPFSYTQRDVSSTDGRVIMSDLSDGVFNGVSCYNYHFSQPRFRSLLQLDE